MSTNAKFPNKIQTKFKIVPQLQDTIIQWVFSQLWFHIPKPISGTWIRVQKPPSCPTEIRKAFNNNIKSLENLGVWRYTLTIQHNVK